MKKILAAAALAAVGAIGVEPALAGPTLDAIKARGAVRCGIPTPSPGFAAPDSAGIIRGIDADICRAVAAALFGDANKVQFIPSTSQQRFPQLQSGEVDMLSRQTTMTFTRDTQLGFDFGPVVLYDGQGFMVKRSLNVTSAKQLNGATICVQPGTTTELNVADYFRANSMTFRAVVIEDPNANREAFISGRCDALTSDRSDLASIRAAAGSPGDFIVLPETISKEPLAPLTRHGDQQWSDIVRWSVYALIAAEELGLNKANVEQTLANTKDPEIKRFLGGEANFFRAAQLPDNWAFNIIKQLGNYGELYEANVGARTPLGLERGINNLWTKGGLMYSPPIR
jgi:general L-amino acid transport system substrate-binding protein